MAEAEKKKKDEKMMDISIAKNINKEAAQKQKNFDKFVKMKKDKAKELCVDQWSQAVQIKNNQEIIDRIFI